MRTLIRLYNNLSLNVVLCTVLCSYMFSKLPNGESTTSWITLTLLAISTWLIYLLDRILDIRIYPPETSERHSFHFQYKKTITYLIAVLIGISIALVFFLPSEVLKYGLCLSAFIAVYLFVLNKYMKTENAQWLKEPFTALFYVAAVVGVVFVAMPVVFLSSWLLLLMFFIVVSQNLLLFSYFEKLLNPQARNSASHFGIKTSEKLNRWSFVAVILLFAIFFAQEFNYKTLVALSITGMSLIFSLMPVFKEKLMVWDRYRWFGDGVLLLSGISLFF